MNKPEISQGGQSDKAYWRIHNGARAVMNMLRVQVEGLEHAQELNDSEEGAIIMASHTSFVDELALTTLGFDRPMRFMGKAEIWEQKRYLLTGVRYAANKAKAYPVRRGDAKSAVNSFKTSLEMLNQGELLAIHPEGSRNKNKDSRTLLETKTGVARMALRSDGITPVLPVGIGYRRTRLLKRSSKYHVGVVVGEPVYVGYADRSQKDLHEELTERLLDAKIRAVDLVEGR